MGNKHIVTAEAVRAAHPDKLCDQIADAILDAHLAQDDNARVAVEVFATNGKILIAGEVTSNAHVNYKNLVLQTLHDLRYKPSDLCSSPNSEWDCDLDLEIKLHEQSPEIAAAVDCVDALDGDMELGAGDQGIMVGYATNETPEMMPLPVVLAQRLCRRMDLFQREVDWMGVDGKAQVSVVYSGNKPMYVKTIVISVQHDATICNDCLRNAILDDVIACAIPENLIHSKTRILINPSGCFIKGGPAADTGLTGRKLAVDQYGPVAHIGGGALSGKDGTKVDRSGAYMARYIAKNIVAAGLAERCEVQLAYAIGRAEPVSVSVDAFGTSAHQNNVLAQIVRRVFDMRPATIIERFDLRAPFFSVLATYGHYGRLEFDLPWEQTDMKDAILREIDRMSRVR